MYPSDDLGGIVSAVACQGKAAAAVPSVTNDDDIQMLVHLDSPCKRNPYLAMKEREGDESGGWLSREERKEDQG